MRVRKDIKCIEPDCTSLATTCSLSVRYCTYHWDKRIDANIEKFISAEMDKE